MNRVRLRSTRAAFGLARVAGLAGLLLSGQALPAEPGPVSTPGWVGAERCADCHEAEFNAWRDSHHDLAMQVANDTTVLGDFNNARFDYAGKTSRFYREGSKFLVQTEGPDGKPARYEIAYAFGVEPLQQYLIPFPDGRLQALSIAWDTRPQESGGQRWFHLYPEESVVAGDPLHWTGPYQNWNLQCADCHSTRLVKNYDADTDRYSTNWSELNVACESCHGPGADHVELAAAGRLDHAAAHGLVVNLAERGDWFWPEGSAIAQRHSPLVEGHQVDTCGRCHSRRSPLGQDRPGSALGDYHEVSLLRDGMYHPDGQILDEVYVYGSFVQSRMYQAGVVCANCHEPHSNALRAPGNGVCAQCHKPDVYDSSTHHHHAAGSEGALCVECHMPTNIYMVVDDRRDHSMRVPRPDLSVVIGTPNACNQCHNDQPADWSLQQLRTWGVDFKDTARHPARSLDLARKGDYRAVPGLYKLAMDSALPAIWRATAAQELGNFSNREALDAALVLLQSDEPMLRKSAAGALSFLPPQQRFRVLSTVLDDPSPGVRLAVARALSDLPTTELPTPDAARLEALFAEYELTLTRHADVPETQMQLGVFYLARGDWKAAEAAYLAALDRNHQLLGAYLNLADLYRAQGRDAAGRDLLLRATDLAPADGAAWHALGLLESRTGNPALALDYLGRAAELETSGTRYRYVHAIALHDSNRIEDALRVLRSLLRAAPDSPDVLMALASYSAEAGLRDDARRYGARLQQLLPDDPGIQQFYDSL